MEIHEAVYQASYPRVELCPQKHLPEYAFIGRSNVGKSSLINMLCGRNSLAKTSKQPGKTQYLNYFLINQSWNIVDLPGYGYAKISKKKRLEWERMTWKYLEKREQLQCAFVLVDSNIPPQQIDIDFMNKLGEKQIPFVIVFTKADKLNINKLNSNLATIRRELKKYWNELPPQFVTSSNNEMGKEDVLNFIQEINKNFYN